MLIIMLLIAVIYWLQWAELSHHNLHGAMLDYMMQTSLVKKKHGLGHNHITTKLMIISTFTAHFGGYNRELRLVVTLSST